MAKTIDWPHIAQRRKAGETVKTLARELRVSGETVYNHTYADGRVRVNGKPAKTEAPAESNGVAVVVSAGVALFKAELQSLKHKRAIIDRAISTLESAHG